MKTMNFFKMILPAIVIMLGSMNVKGQVNLLENPGFEEPAVSATNALSTETMWEVVPDSWFQSYYPNYSRYASANRADIDETFFSSGNGQSISGVRTGKYTGRLPLNGTSGIYQLVNVTEGKRYSFSLNIALTTINTNQTVKDDETVKILYVDGTLFYEVPIPGNEKTVMNITGTTPPIPEGITQMRFQVDQRDYLAGEGAPLMLIDECEFYEDDSGDSTGLLKNGKFTPAAVATPTDWTMLNSSELTDLFGDTGGGVQSNNYGVPSTFWGLTGNGAGGNSFFEIAPYDGNENNGCLRLQAANTAGVYQEVAVTAGHIYEIKASAIHFKTTTGITPVPPDPAPQTYRSAYIKIMAVSEPMDLTAAPLAEVELTFDPDAVDGIQSWDDFSGSVTIPPGVSSIWFVICHQNINEVGYRVCGTLIDNCELNDLGVITGLIGEANAANDKVVEIRYYDLLGREISQPVENTVYIVKKVYESKKNEVSKILFRSK